MENLTTAEIKRKIVIWNRLNNDPKIMEIAGGLVIEVLEKLHKLLRDKNEKK